MPLPYSASIHEMYVKPQFGRYFEKAKSRGNPRLRYALFNA